MLLTLVRQLVELRHLERAAPLFQRLPAAVHCGAETVFAREVRMRSSLPAVRRTAALLPPLLAEAGPAPPAPALGGGAAEWGRASPLRSRPRPGRREGEGGRAARPVSRRPYLGPAPERGESGESGASCSVPPGPAPGPRRPPPPGLAPGARFESRAAAAGTVGCLFRVGKRREGGKEAPAG